jgi:hypothetical protein
MGRVMPPIFGVVLAVAGLITALFPRICQRFIVGMMRPKKSRIDASLSVWYASDMYLYTSIVGGILVSAFGFATIFVAITRALHHAV